MGEHFPPRDVPEQPPPSKDAGLGTGQPDYVRPFLVARVRDGWMGLPQTTAFVDGMVLYSATVSDVGSGYRVMLKAKRRGIFYVSFANGTTWIDALECVLEWAEKGVLTWRVDKYPPT